MQKLTKGMLWWSVAKISRRYKLFVMFVGFLVLAPELVEFLLSLLRALKTIKQIRILFPGLL